jgi:glutaminyl-peptide cyclotransferase
LQVEDSFTYDGEGWGLTYNGEHLIRSDGSNTLYFHDLDGKLQDTLEVYDAGNPIRNLNELEWLPEQGLILANIWGAERIAAIEPTSGQVILWLGMSDLVPQNLRGNLQKIPNGIALAPDGKTLWLTGKLWPVIHVVAWPPEELR